MNLIGLDGIFLTIQFGTEFYEGWKEIFKIVGAHIMEQNKYELIILILGALFAASEYIGASPRFKSSGVFQACLSVGKKIFESFKLQK